MNSPFTVRVLLANTNFFPEPLKLTLPTLRFLSSNKSRLALLAKAMSLLVPGTLFPIQFEVVLKLVDEVPRQKIKLPSGM